MVSKFLFGISNKSSIILSYVIDILAAFPITYSIFSKNIFYTFVGIFLIISSEVYRNQYKKINNDKVIVVNDVKNL